jgi:shikimate kinase
MPKKSAIGQLASKKTKSEFADVLSSYTQLTKEEISAIFPKKGDREELLALVEIVNSATDENTKKAMIAEKIGKVSGAVVKLVKNFASGL